MGKGGPAAFAMFTSDAHRVPSFASLDIDSTSTTAKPRVLVVLGVIMDRIVRSNEVAAAAAAASAGGSTTSSSSSSSDENLTVFHGQQAPGVSIPAYLDRIFKYAHCSPSAYALAYVYIDRMMKRMQQRAEPMLITSLNVHRLLVTGVLIAAKFLDDAHFNNAYFAKVGGISLEEMNRLEMEMLFRLDFRLQVSPDDFARYCDLLAQDSAGMHAELEMLPGASDPAADTATSATACKTRSCSSDGSSSGSSCVVSPASSDSTFSSASSSSHARSASGDSWNASTVSSAASHVISFFSPQNHICGASASAHGAAPHSAGAAVSHAHASAQSAACAERRADEAENRASESDADDVRRAEVAELVTAVGQPMAQEHERCAFAERLGVSQQTLLVGS